MAPGPGVVLFGEMSGRKTCCFHDAQSPVSMHQKIRWDYPCEGMAFVRGWWKLLAKYRRGFA
jgi:hypothetical protein